MIRSPSTFSRSERVSTNNFSSDLRNVMLCHSSMEEFIGLSIWGFCFESQQHHIFWRSHPLHIRDLHSALLDCNCISDCFKKIHEFMEAVGCDSTLLSEVVVIGWNEFVERHWTVWGVFKKLHHLENVKKIYKPFNKMVFWQQTAIVSSSKNQPRITYNTYLWFKSIGQSQFLGSLIPDI